MCGNVREFAGICGKWESTEISKDQPELVGISSKLQESTGMERSKLKIFCLESYTVYTLGQMSKNCLLNNFEKCTQENFA